MLEVEPLPGSLPSGQNSMQMPDIAPETLAAARW
jgi:hypothetical protein